MRNWRNRAQSGGKRGRWGSVAFLCVFFCGVCAGCSRDVQEDGFVFRAPENPDIIIEGSTPEEKQPPPEGEEELGEGREPAENAAEDSDGSVKAGEEESAVCWVHVCGEVNFPGVYELPSGARWYEAVEAAGGFCSLADDSAVNLAALVEDGQKIYIPAEGEELPGDTGYAAEGSGSMAARNGKVNLNTAGREELMTLKGIGESRAEEILEYRNAQGGFSSVEELKNISGIGDKTFEKLRDYVTVD